MSNRGVHSEQSRVMNDDCGGCVYCGLSFGRMHHEHDHAPVPKSAGGATRLPSCITCHDLKDRVTFERWPAGMLAEAVSELIARGRMTDFHDGALFHATLPTALPTDWSGMSRAARLAWAKMARLAYVEPLAVPVLT